MTRESQKECESTLFYVPVYWALHAASFRKEDQVHFSLGIALVYNILMKTIRVVAAVIQSKDVNGRPVVLATQRGYGEYKDGWEFPGGKIEPGETPKEALIREIKEELKITISVGDLIDTIEYD